MRLSANFLLEEFLPLEYDVDQTPEEVTTSLQILCVTVLEPARQHFGVPFVITSGYRPPAKNALVGGVATSDHMFGRAADFHLKSSTTESWEDLTKKCYDWMAKELVGRYGQLIFEDHRKHYGVPGKLWIHASIPSASHPGTADDKNRLLVSYRPKRYERPVTENLA